MKINEKGFQDEIDNFNLLIAFKEIENLDINEINTIQPEIKGMEEIENALNNTESFFYIKESEFYDVVTVDLDLNPTLAIEQFKKMQTLAIKKVIPIDLVVPTLKEVIIKDILKIASSKIEKGESFTIKCELRNKKYIKSSQELINQISNEIHNQLGIQYQENNADWIVIIEELGTVTGIGIFRTEYMLIN